MDRDPGGHCGAAAGAADGAGGGGARHPRARGVRRRAATPCSPLMLGRFSLVSRCKASTLPHMLKERGAQLPESSAGAHVPGGRVWGWGAGSWARRHPLQTVFLPQFIAPGSASHASSARSTVAEGLGPPRRGRGWGGRWRPSGPILERPTVACPSAAHDARPTLRPGPWVPVQESLRRWVPGQAAGSGPCAPTEGCWPRVREGHGKGGLGGGGPGGAGASDCQEA